MRRRTRETSQPNIVPETDFIEEVFEGAKNQWEHFTRNADIIVQHRGWPRVDEEREAEQAEQIKRNLGSSAIS